MNSPFALPITVPLQSNLKSRLQNPLARSAPAQIMPTISKPTPSFGAANLRAWWDKNKSFSDHKGNVIPSFSIDGLGGDTVSAIDDLTGNGYGWIQADKTLQGSKGPTGGVVFDTPAAVMNLVRKDLFKGLSRFSFFANVIPKTGAVRRVLLQASEGFTSQAPYAFALVSGGSGYAVGDFIVMSSTFKVTAVDGNGAITGMILAVPLAVANIPANPVAQSSTSRPGGAATGVGASVNLTFPPIGEGTGKERFSLNFTASNAGRKSYAGINAFDGTSIAVPSGSATAGTSLGAPNGAELVDKATPHRVGLTVDMTVSPCVAKFYYDGAVDHAETWTPTENGGVAPWALAMSDSVSVLLGNGNGGNLSAALEFRAGLVLGEVPDAARLAQIDTYLAAVA